MTDFWQMGRLDLVKPRSQEMGRKGEVGGGERERLYRTLHCLADGEPFAMDVIGRHKDREESYDVIMTGKSHTS